MDKRIKRFQFPDEPDIRWDWKVGTYKDKFYVALDPNPYLTNELYISAWYMHPNLRVYPHAGKSGWFKSEKEAWDAILRYEDQFGIKIKSPVHQYLDDDLFEI